MTEEQLNSCVRYPYMVSAGITSENFGPRPDYWDVEYHFFDANHGVQDITAVISGDRWYRVFNGGSAKDWKQIAIATPPQWVKAVLQNGYIDWNVGVEFGKANGRLSLRGGFMQGAATMAGMETILILPEGYRPSKLKTIPVISTGPAWCGLVDIYADGTVRWNGQGVSPLHPVAIMNFPASTEIWLDAQ